MNLYEHTIVARQDTSPAQLKQLQEKYSKIVEKNQGNVVKLENWGLMNLSYLIKKNKKGNYLHFKIEANGWGGDYRFKIIFEDNYTFEGSGEEWIEEVIDHLKNKGVIK